MSTRRERDKRHADDQLAAELLRFVRFLRWKIADDRGDG